MENKARNIAIKAKDIFMKFGLRSVSMDDISRELGISKKTLYQYYGNKQQLIESMLDYVFEEFEGFIKIVENKKLDAIDDLLEVSKLMNKQLEASNPSVSFDLKKYYPEIDRQVENRKTRVALQYIRANIEKGIAEGIYREDLNIDLIATLYVQKLEVLHHTGEPFDQTAFENIFEVMFENHIRGISNKKGLKLFEKRKELLKH